ncbi:hypothetical protein E4656_18700 [Natronospirillum operosum]|uniref:Peptidase M3A/M3B catalytic domain-containing protein n=1 Tax=Natronospirillum operosum TaxID=2759953 RepID=A0A4Z0WAE7_9GAMM|nr:hypothetical protein [Natronospirillum operosum]TGG90294.1 hypothetical protein E4656_18700 [Natronospirillum operosum]
MDSQWQIQCLDISEMQASAAQLEQWAGEIATAIPTALKCATPDTLRPLIREYLDLDQAFEALSAQITLQRLEGRTTKQSQSMLERLQADLSQTLMAQTQPLLSELQQHSDHWCIAMPEHQTWLTSLQRYRCDQPDFAQTLRTLGAQYQQLASQLQPEKGSCRAALADLLRQRVELEKTVQGDGLPLALRLWCRQNDVDKKQLTRVLEPEFQAVHHYIREVQHQNALSFCTLNDFRAFEQDRMAIPAMLPEDAVQLILQALNDLNPQSAERLHLLVQKGRLAVRPSDSNTVPLCLDTPMGSWVRLPYVPDLYHLMLLMHELGHALHQEQHRAAGNGHIPLPAVESEMAALSAEQTLAHWLMQSGGPMAEPADHYLQYQRMEMDHRHRMLARFELALHDLPEVTEQSISQLWLNVNQAFYGETIELPEDFQWVWCEVHHFFTAPYYLLAYPLAMRNAQPLTDMSL